MAILGVFFPEQLTFSFIRKGFLTSIPKLGGNIIDLLFMLKNFLSVTFKEQGSYTQYVGIKSFKLQRQKASRYMVEYK